MGGPVNNPPAALSAPATLPQPPLRRRRIPLHLGAQPPDCDSGSPLPEARKLLALLPVGKSCRPLGTSATYLCRCGRLSSRFGYHVRSISYSHSRCIARAIVSRSPVGRTTVCESFTPSRSAPRTIGRPQMSVTSLPIGASGFPSSVPAWPCVRRVSSVS